MALIRADNLTFRYREAPGRDPGPPALRNASLQVEEGGFCVVSGPTGCGKSTLLRLMKSELAPRGEVGGDLVVCGAVLARDGAYRPMDPLASARAVGFVAQDPQAQIVCDSVRTELAFGLENAGVQPPEMGRRMAEVAGFLGIEGWMGRATADLSGGQKQLLNLAAALALRPRLLLLDEPTAQLDPHACRRLLDALAGVNAELGVTIVMTTHSPELAERMATQRIELEPLPPLAPPAAPGPPGDGSRGDAGGAGRPLVELDRAAFRYGAGGPWVLEDASLSLRGGRIHALTGANGSGKTTLLKLLAGICKPQRGRRKADARLRQAYLPQDPKALFACDTVRDELHEWHARHRYGAQEEIACAARFGLEGLMEQHPYDLSGGQQQQLALAKLLLTAPRALFLDEPTKGMDALASARMADAVREIARQGAAVAVATHDAAFIRALADEVSLVFDGMIACTLPAGEFFADSLVYRADGRSRLFGAMRR